MNNRLTAPDEAASATRDLAPAGAGAGPERSPDTDSHDVAMTRLQRAVARRMSAAKAAIPEFVTEVDIDMVAVTEIRDERKRQGGFVPSYNDFVIKACASALARVPQVNASFADDHFTLHRRINVGVAVGAKGVLIVPTVFDADRMTVDEIGRCAATLAGKIGDGSIRADELTGATFTVTNLGMYGVRRFVAVINPPQVAILAVGAVEDRVVARNGKSEIRRQMTAALSADHRVVYGTDAGEFLGAVREGLEAPEGILG